MSQLTSIADRFGSALKLNPTATQKRIVTGSLTMLVGSGMVALLNLIYNVGIAHLLGPIAFGEVAAIYTLLMLLSAITLTLQLVCAKFVARNDSPGAKAAVYLALRRRAWYFGATIALLLILASRPLAVYLNLSSPILVILLAVGIAFYIPLGVRRGGMQGTYAFRKLALNFVLEGVVKLGGALVLIRMGTGVIGAIAAVSASVIIAYVFSHPGHELEASPQPGIPASFREVMQAIVFFVGQVIINNIDIVLVKHFFSPEQAGLYAAAALVGRVVYMSSWSVVSAMFPISAGATPAKQNDRGILAAPLAIVLFITGSFALLLSFFPNLVWRAVFGADFLHRDLAFYSSLLVLYAVATGVYSLCVVLITYEMSRKLANSAWIQLAFSAAIVLGILAFHNTLQQVVLVQLVMLAVLLVTVTLPFLRSPARVRPEPLIVPARVTMRKLRAMTEDEVISEFLRNEFHHREFDADRQKFTPVVETPDLSNPQQNRLRRALLFRRRGGMWRELPGDTQWWEVELGPEEIARMRFFPRAMWRKFSNGSFYITDMIERIRTARSKARGSQFNAKMEEVISALRRQNSPATSVLLIAEAESRPFTIIEGNHRVAAAMQISPEFLRSRLRFICGLSPRMHECCWYKTNLRNLWRYARNKARHLAHDPESDMDRLLQLPTETPAIQ
ncbi:MAG TPA: oligosaccharide flippase family protein [Terriglobales bacterium]|nr:oligosaccharide flippase family protein [Terriglobales bacterium]